MSFVWILDLVLWVIAAAATVMVVVSWVHGMSHWERALVTGRQAPRSQGQWAFKVTESVPWMVLVCLIVMCGLFAYNHVLDAEANVRAKDANDQAIARANAVALARAGVIDASASALVQLAPQAVARGSSVQAFGDSVGSESSAIVEGARQILEAKKAQQAAARAIQNDSHLAHIANLLSTFLITVFVAASLASFFAGKGPASGFLSGTWILFFVTFLAFGVGVCFVYGGVKVFKEPISGTSHEQGTPKLATTTTPNSKSDSWNALQS